MMAANNFVTLSKAVETGEDLAKKIEGTRLYHDLAGRSLATLTAVEPLTAFDPNRKRLQVDRPMPILQRKAHKRSDKS